MMSYIDDIASKFKFPQSVDIRIAHLKSESAALNEVSRQTNFMLREQMSTFGLTIDRIEKISNWGGNTLREIFVDKLNNVVILEVEAVSDGFDKLCKACITYRYENR